MSRINESIQVQAPLAATYDQWTRFEEFPRFMEGVDRVVRLDDTTLEWTATIAGVTKSWRAKVVDQVPDQRISWIATEGARNDGVVTFQSLGADMTQVDLALDVDPEGPAENLGDALGIVKARVRGDLERFRDFLENSLHAGTWRAAGRRTVAAGEAELEPGRGAGAGFAEGEATVPLSALGSGIGAGGGFAAGSTDLSDAELLPAQGAGAGFAEGATALPDSALGPGTGAGGGFAEGETEADLDGDDVTDLGTEPYDRVGVASGDLPRGTHR